MASRPEILAILLVAKSYALSAAKKNPTLDCDELIGAAGLGVSEGLNSYDSKKNNNEKVWVLGKAWYAIQESVRQQYGGRPAKKNPRVEVTLDHAEFHLAMSTEDTYEDTKANDLLWSDIDSLSDRDRAVVVLTTLEDVTLSDVGKMIGLSESRICQIRTRGLEYLRLRIQARNTPY